MSLEYPFSGSHRGSLLVCVCIAVLWTALRAPGFHAIDVRIHSSLPLDRLIYNRETRRKLGSSNENRCRSTCTRTESVTTLRVCPSSPRISLPTPSTFSMISSLMSVFFSFFVVYLTRNWKKWISLQFFHLFVSFCVLFILNLLIVHRLRLSHQNARRNSSCPNVVLSAVRLLLFIPKCCWRIPSSPFTSSNPQRSPIGGELFGTQFCTP